MEQGIDAIERYMAACASIGSRAGPLLRGLLDERTVRRDVVLESLAAVEVHRFVEPGPS